MKNIVQIIFLLLIPCILIGQTKYIYRYEGSLNPGLSKFSKQIKNLKTKSDSSLVSFKVFDKKGDPIAGVIINIEDDQSKEIQTDLDGCATIILSNKSYNFLASHIQFTEMKIPNIKLNTGSKVIINVILGNKNVLRNAIIKSKQKLTKSEVEKILEDLSNENEENNSLIKNKVCLISWEI